MRIVAPLLIIAWLAANCQAAAADDGDEEDESPYRAGVIAESVGKDGVVVRRIEPAIAHRGGGDLADPRLATGGYKLTWRGFLQPQADGRYRFHVAADGA